MLSPKEYMMEKKSAYHRYLRNFGLACGAYVGTIIIYVLLSSQLAENTPLRYAVALLPMIPTGFALYYQIMVIRHTDELQRRLFSEAYVISSLGVGFFTFSYGFLEQAGLPQFSTFFYFPLTVGVWGIANALLQRSYQ